MLSRNASTFARSLDDVVVAAAAEVEAKEADAEGAPPPPSTRAVLVAGEPALLRCVGDRFLWWW
jgi:hypothetical protein